MIRTAKKSRPKYNVEVLEQVQHFIMLNPQLFDPDRVFNGNRSDIPGTILRVYFKKSAAQLKRIFPLEINAMQVAANILELRLDQCEPIFYINDWHPTFLRRWEKCPPSDEVARAWIVSDLIADFKDRIERSL